METQPSSHPAQSNGSHSDPSVAPPSWFWDSASLLMARWKLVATITGVAAVLAIALALALPKEYAAGARVMQPDASGLSGLMGIADRASGGLGRLLTGGSRGDYTRYLAILDSRSLRERVIEEFDLVTVYGVADREHPMEDALKRLDRNLDFRINPEFQDLSIIAYDREPERSAAMANFLADELNRRHASMTSDNARRTRVFVEHRLAEARADLDSLQAEMQLLQETHGVVELESQAQAFLTTMGAQAARTAELEVRYHTLLSQYGPENPAGPCGQGRLRRSASAGAAGPGRQRRPDAGGPS